MSVNYTPFIIVQYGGTLPVEKLVGRFQQRCRELDEQLAYWRAELAIARETRIADRTIRCERVIELCEKVIANLNDAAQVAPSKSDHDDRSFFFHRPP